MKAILSAFLIHCSVALVAAQVIPKTPILRTEIENHQGVITDLSVDAKGKVALTTSLDGTARLWSVPSLKLLKVLRPALSGTRHDGVISGALSPDGTKALISCMLSDGRLDRSTIQFFDTTTGSVLFSLVELQQFASDIAFSPDGKYVAITFSGDDGLHIFDQDGVLVGKHTGFSVPHQESLAWHSNNLFVAGRDDILRRYNAPAFKFVKGKVINLEPVVAKLIPGLENLALSPDGDGLAVTHLIDAGEGKYKTKLSVLHAGTLEVTSELAGREEAHFHLAVAWSLHSMEIASAFGWREDDHKIGLPMGYVWKRGGSAKSQPLPIPIDQAGREHSILHVKPIEDGGFIFSTHKGCLGVVSRDPVNERWTSLIKNDCRSHFPTQALQISEDGTEIRRENDYRYTVEDRCSMSSFSVLRREHLVTVLTTDDDFAKDREIREKLFSHINEDYRRMDKMIRWDKDEIKFEGSDLAIPAAELNLSHLQMTHLTSGIPPNGNFCLIGTAQRLWRFERDGSCRWKIESPSPIWRISITQNGSIAVVQLEDTTVRWYRTSDGAELLTLFLPADESKAWVMWASYETPPPKMSGLRVRGKNRDGQGFEVQVVDANGLADKAGVQSGDTIVSVGDDTPYSREKLTEFLQSREIEERFPITVKRGDSVLTLTATAELNTAPPENRYYYDCSPGGEKLAGWHINADDECADFFPLSKFRDQFYRPDVIQHILREKDIGKAVAFANTISGRERENYQRMENVILQTRPPVLEILTGEVSGTLQTIEKRVEVRYRIRQGGSPLVRLKALLDGRPVNMAIALPENDESESSFMLEVPDRDCVLTLLAENQFAVSEPSIMRIIRGNPSDPSQPKVSSALKPTLYLLAAGISDYLSNEHIPDLQYAAKDASDFAASFQKQEGGLYGKVVVRLLKDSQATAGDVLDGLDWIKKETTTKDVAIVFLSGHGENDQELRYYFCPYDYDRPRRLRTAIAMDDIQKTLAAIPGKVIFFIDSCHSGDVLGKRYAIKGGRPEVDITGLVNELSSAENGAVVFASSTGRQNSSESEEWQNGAFTKAIVEGLDGKADLLGNGKITISSLETWMAERVKELTEGVQTPTVAKPQTIPDFPIGLKR